MAFASKEDETLWIAQAFPKWRFLNCWLPIEKAHTFSLLNIWWDWHFIGIVVFNFGIEYRRH